MNKNFSQTIAVRTSQPEQLLELLAEWDVAQSQTDVMGYMGMRVLADRQDPGSFLIIADFGIVDPDVPAAEEADRNNARPETQATAARLQALVDGDPEYHHYDELYRTDY